MARQVTRLVLLAFFFIAKASAQSEWPNVFTSASGYSTLRAPLIAMVMVTNVWAYPKGLNGSWSGRSLLNDDPEFEYGYAYGAAESGAHDVQWPWVGRSIAGKAAGDNSGAAVAMSGSGTTVAVGAPYNDGNIQYSNMGHVRVYDWNTDNRDWTQRGGDIDGFVSQGIFGGSVGMSTDGNVVVGGAMSAEVDGLASAGYVAIYAWVDGNWALRGDVIGGRTAGEEFGQPCALSGDGNVVAGGAWKRSTLAGGVDVYAWDGTMWSQRGQSIDGLQAGDEFGFAVKLSHNGSILVASAPKSDGAGGSDSGQVRVLEWDGTVWLPRGPSLNGIQPFEKFGNSVDVNADGSRLVAGAPYASEYEDGDPSGTVLTQANGVARIYEWDGEQYSLLEGPALWHRGFKLRWLVSGHQRRRQSRRGFSRLRRLYRVLGFLLLARGRGIDLRSDADCLEQELSIEPSPQILRRKQHGLRPFGQVWR